MRRLALCYLDGKEGVARDWTAAAGWLRKAAEAGSIKSGLGYAAMLFAGEGVARDPPPHCPGQSALPKQGSPMHRSCLAPSSGLWRYRRPIR